MKHIVTQIKLAVRKFMRGVAQGLDTISGGRVSPNAVTYTGLAMHVPIAVLIATGYFWQAALLLVVFGLFDTLDGELARLQGRSSDAGMLLDASTDRIKEVLLYAGVGYYLADHDSAGYVAVAVLALGLSICVSYVKAKGEAAVASRGKKIDHHTLNRMFADGVLSFEMRMAALVVGLLTGALAIVVVIVAVLSAFTVVTRLRSITKALAHVQD